MRSLTILLLHLFVFSTLAAEQCDSPLQGNRDVNPCCCFFCNMDQVSPPQDIKCFFQNVHQYAMTDIISKGSKPVNALPESSSDDFKNFLKNQLLYPPHDSYTILNALELSNTDAFVVMHKGKVVYEKYWDQTASMRHAIFSCTKSYFALVAAMMAHDGELDPEELVVTYVPELKDVKAFEDATVRHIMDMTVAIDFDEKSYGPGSDISKLSAIQSSVGTREGIRQYIKPHPDRPHGDTFEYATLTTDVLGWIIDNCLGGNGKALEYFQNNIWSKLGQEHDLMVSINTGSYVDENYNFYYNGTVPKFASYGGGGLATARDMARFGQMMLDMGKSADGMQIVPQEVIEDIMSGGTEENIQQYNKSRECPTGNCGGAYRNMFRVTPGIGAYYQSGIHGQWVYVDTQNDYVAVKQSSQSSALEMSEIDYFLMRGLKDGLKGNISKSKKSKRSKGSKGSKAAKGDY